jgi:hypothetical protein
LDGDVTDARADELEALVREALSAGDPEGVQAALVGLAVIDPARAARLLDTLQISLDLEVGSRADGD